MVNKYIKDQQFCPAPIIPKNGISFGGNLNIPGYQETQVFRIANQLTTRYAGRTEFYNANINRSAPPPPRNTFG